MNPLHFFFFEDEPTDAPQPGLMDPRYFFFFVSPGPFSSIFSIEPVSVLIPDTETFGGGEYVSVLVPVESN